VTIVGASLRGSTKRIRLLSLIFERGVLLIALIATLGVSLALL
jgi:hypothetical protein